MEIPPYNAQKTKQVAAAGPSAFLRHPQYAGFIHSMTGFLFQWPAFLTAIMFPFLVFMYAPLAKREEKDTLVEAGDPYSANQKGTPAFFPRLRFSHFGLD